MLRTGLIFVTLSVIYVIPSSINNYGPFDIKLTEAHSCKGPKRKDCVLYRVSINGGKNLTCDMTVKENAMPVKGNIIGTLDKRNVMKLQITKPCDHLFMRPILQSLLKMTDNCLILKGHYVFTINLEEIINSYYGGSFLYGNWTYKTIFYNDDCNFACTKLNIMFTPKKKRYT